MSVNVLVYGADKESDEYKAAVKLKRIINDSIPKDATGEIVLFASATLYGQAVKDIDLLMIGDIKSGYSITADFITNNGYVKDQVTIRSFCTTIEIKRHDISGITVTGTDFYVKYGKDSHCVTDQSNKQKISTMEFLRRTQAYSPYVTNVIWFTQATSSDIKGLITNNGKIMPSNVLGRDFDFKELIQLLILQNPPIKNGRYYKFDCGCDQGSFKSIENALQLFSKTKEQMGELTRRRIEQLTNSSFDNALVETGDKFSILRGRAGTGKTVGLIQTALRLIDDEQARVLLLTYNKALVSDIRRLLALAEMPDMFEERCLHINTMHSYFFRLSNKVLYEGKLSGEKYLEKYDSVMNELLCFMEDEDAISIIKDICSSDDNLNWDYILLDEAQDCSAVERDVILKLYDSGHIIVADGGQQFVRGLEPCDWSVVKNKNNIKLKYCLRQKENLVEFINSFSQEFGVLGSKVLSKSNMPGGKVIITTNDHLLSVHESEIKRLLIDGNTAYDMLYLVPHTLVNKSAENQFAFKEQFEQNGIKIWDGTSPKERDSYSISTDEIRLLQYDSARGLEGWTVVCMDLDVFIHEKERDYTMEKADSLILESPEERKKKYLHNWLMIPFTRAIDSLVITLNNPESDIGKKLQRIAVECPDYVYWIC